MIRRRRRISTRSPPSSTTLKRSPSTTTARCGRRSPASRSRKMKPQPTASGATPPSSAIAKSKPPWGETTLLWPDFRMDTSTRILLGQSGDYDANQAFSSGGWFMLRSAPNYPLGDASGALLAKMDTTAHDRGWDLSVAKGIVSVELINQGPKNLNPGKTPNLKHPDPNTL